MNVYTEMLHILERDGWQQGAYGHITGPNCLMGALARVDTTARPWVKEERIRNILPTHTERAIGQYLDIEDVPTWNDAPERTFADVKALLSELAERADGNRVEVPTEVKERVSV